MAALKIPLVLKVSVDGGEPDVRIKVVKMIPKGIEVTCGEADEGVLKEYLIPAMQAKLDKLLGKEGGDEEGGDEEGGDEEGGDEDDPIAAAKKAAKDALKEGMPDMDSLKEGLPDMPDMPEMPKMPEMPEGFPSFGAPKIDMTDLKIVEILFQNEPFTKAIRGGEEYLLQAVIKPQALIDLEESMPCACCVIA
jgi:hypothetical protein